MSVLIPFQIRNGRLLQAGKTKEAVDAFLELLLSTPCGSCVCDPNFGFVFNNLKFEIFNEKEGVIYHAETEGITSDLYDKKVSGTSKSVNTFATELKKAIEQYEKRLTDVTVSMTYKKNLKKIQINIEGVLVENQESYHYSTHIDLWN